VGERTAFTQRYGQAVDALRTDELRSVEDTIEETARRMLGFMGGKAAQAFSVRFGFTDPGSPHSSLRLLCNQDGVLLPADALGSGEQSAIVVGMFEAFRQKGTGLNTVLIEEPEMYLHPQAQRYLKRLLVDLVDAEQAQIITTTHSPVFADMTRFRSLRLLRNGAGGATIGTRVKDPDDLSFLDNELARAKLTQYFNAESAEVLFSRGALLVEGHGDRLAALEVAKRMGLDVDGEGLSVVDCGGKNALPFYARVCRSLAIPFVVLHDSDVYDGDDLAQWQRDENTRALDANERIRAAAGPDAAIYAISPSLETKLGVGRSAANKPMHVLKAVKDRELEALPASLVDAVREMARLASSPAPEREP
jgi:hypothetical protein